MRRARAGPIRGSRSRDSAGAVSRSKGVEVVEGFEPIEETSAAGCLDSLPLDCLPLDDLDDPRLRAESTSAICCSRAALAAAGDSRRCLARCNRTLAPSSATAAKNSIALRSEGVGTGESWASGARAPSSRRVTADSPDSTDRDHTDRRLIHDNFLTYADPS